MNNSGTFESRRRAALHPVIEQLDQGMALLIEEIRIRRGSSAFALYDALPTPFRKAQHRFLLNHRAPGIHSPSRHSPKLRTWVRFPSPAP